MFDSALITRAEVDRHVDIALVCETIFFYQSVQLLLNSASINALALRVHSNDLLALFSRTGIKLSYLRPGFAVASTGVPKSHQFVAVTFAGSQTKRFKSHKDEIAEGLTRALGRSASTNKLAKTISDHVSLHRFKPAMGGENVVPKLAQDDLQDAAFVRSAALAVLQESVPLYTPPPDLRFEVFQVSDGYAVDTNINFAAINSLYRQSIPPSCSPLSPEMILGHIINARADSYFAANYMAEIVTSPVYSNLIRLKYFDFLRRRESSLDQLTLFRDLVLPDTPSIRDAINSGARTIPEFLKLLDHAEKFRDWLKTANPDTDLVRSYYKAATKDTWAEKLPTKTARFAIVTGLGAAAEVLMPSGLGIAAGATIGAADALFSDRLIKGWRPNQFIQGDYRQFVEGN